MEEVWFLDSSCNNPITGNKEWFSELDESFSQTVKLGNKTRMDVVGKGIIRMQVSELTQAIADVYYVLELKNNLVEAMSSKVILMMPKNQELSKFQRFKNQVSRIKIQG